MRPIRDYPSLTVPDLEDELCQVASVLERTMEALAKAKTVHHCDNLRFYYENLEESHAARQRVADYNTQTQFADVIEFEQAVAAYRLNYETLISFISWRRSDIDVFGPSRV